MGDCFSKNQKQPESTINLLNDFDSSIDDLNVIQLTHNKINNLRISQNFKMK